MVGLMECLLVEKKEILWVELSEKLWVVNLGHYLVEKKVA
jgi:hypothetical protein